MAKASTRTKGPSKESLREMPEMDLQRAVRRNPYAIDRGGNAFQSIAKGLADACAFIDGEREKGQAHKPDSQDIEAKAQVAESQSKHCNVSAKG